MSAGLLIIGNDKIGRRCVSELKHHTDRFNSIAVGLDCSSDIFRVFRLIHKNKMSLTCVTKMVWAEFRRFNYPQIKDAYRIYDNQSLHKIMCEMRPPAVYLFRCGLIVNKENLSLGFPFYNIHCADLPQFSGLCSIDRALKAKKLQQRACIHRVTSRIDDVSMIVDFEPYTLDDRKSYFQNEETAYGAGIRLLTKNLNGIK